MPLSRPPCPGLKLEDSAVSLSPPLRKGVCELLLAPHSGPEACGTLAGPPLLSSDITPLPPPPPGCPNSGWLLLASRGRLISGKWANTPTLKSCTTILTVVFDLTPDPSVAGWSLMAHVISEPSGCLEHPWSCQGSWSLVFPFHSPALPPHPIHLFLGAPYGSWGPNQPQFLPTSPCHPAPSSPGAT